LIPSTIERSLALNFKYCDGTTKKNKIWEDIGEELHQIGYQTSSGNKPGVICSQKWSNIMKTSKNFTLLVEKSGSSANVLGLKPQFYEDIHNILDILF
jgi:hypothetical protein